MKPNRLAMNRFRSPLFSRRTRTGGLALLAAAGAIVGLGAAQIALAGFNVADVYELEFGEDRVTFCSEGGPISTSSAEVALGERGFETPGDAVAAFEAEQRDAASNPEIPEELRSMLGPTREARYAQSADSAPDRAAFFDIPSQGPADLEARVVVNEYPGDGWKVTEVVQCMSVVVTDIEKYNELAEEVYKQ